MIVALERGPSRWWGRPDVLGVCLGRKIIEIEIKRSVADVRNNADKECMAMRRQGVALPPQQFYFLVEAKAQALMPTQCDECPYIFEDGDHRGTNETPLYSRSDTGQLITLLEATVGAMWLADWFAPAWGSPVHHAERPNQPHLIVKTPGGDWDVDAKSANGGGWHWEGTPPNVTATPSILIESSLPKYHGWLRNGELVDC
jgi:hypothetical protein